MFAPTEVFVPTEVSVQFGPIVVIELGLVAVAPLLVPSASGRTLGQTVPLFVHRWRAVFSWPRFAGELAAGPVATGSLGELGGFGGFGASLPW